MIRYFVMGGGLELIRLGKKFSTNNKRTHTGNQAGRGGERSLTLPGTPGVTAGKAVS